MHEKACTRHLSQAGDTRASKPGGSVMNDTAFIAMTLVFFGLCAAYVHFCDKVR
jgi:hypothetical protein